MKIIFTYPFNCFRGGEGVLPVSSCFPLSVLVPAPALAPASEAKPATAAGVGTQGPSRLMPGTPNVLPRGVISILI